MKKYKEVSFFEALSYVNENPKNKAMHIDYNEFEGVNKEYYLQLNEHLSFYYEDGDHIYSNSITKELVNSKKWQIIL